MILLLKEVTVLLLTTFITCLNVSSMMSHESQIGITVDRALTRPHQIQSRPAQKLPEETLENDLNQIMNIKSHVENNSSDQYMLILFGNAVLGVTENLVSALVRKQCTNESISISLQTLEVQVIMIGQNTSMKKTLSLSTSTGLMDFELNGISNSTNASVAFMSYTNMAAILNPRVFNTWSDKTKTMMSSVVSATLLQATETNFTSVSFTFTHVKEFDPDGVLSCVHWEQTEWDEDGCNITETNNRHIVCTCDHTFAVIMKTTDPMLIRNSIFWKNFITAVLAVGIIFLSLSALTLAFCHPNTKASNMPLICLCISLLLGMIFFLVTQHFNSQICPQKQLSVILDGILLFLYLSAAMWMLIEAVHLFLFVKNLSKVRSNQGKWLSWKWLIVIGYFIPLVLVTVYGLAFHGDYTVLLCIGYLPGNVMYIYYAPFYVILVTVLVLFIIIITILIFTLIRLKNGNLQRSNITDKKNIMSIMIKSIAQFFILGLPWIIIFIPISNMMAYYVFMFFCSQQGTFIFLVHCLFNQEVTTQHIVLTQTLIEL